MREHPSSRQLSVGEIQELSQHSRLVIPFYRALRDAIQAVCNMDQAAADLSLYQATEALSPEDGEVDRILMSQYCIFIDILNSGENLAPIVEYLARIHDAFE